MTNYKPLIDFIEARYGDIGYTLDDSRHSETALSAIQTINSFFPLKDKYILDVGCGNGRDLETFEQFGAKAYGVTMEKPNGPPWTEPYNIEFESDFSFLHLKDQELDLVFARHVLEHSLFPYFSLTEFNRVLKTGGLLYVEVPAPNQKCNHESNHNHYSILGAEMWRSLLSRTGFQPIMEKDLKFIDESGELWDTWNVFIYQKISEPAPPWHAKEMNEPNPHWV